MENLPQYKWLILLLISSLALDFFQYLIKGYVGQRVYQKREEEIIKKAQAEKKKPDLDNTDVDGYPNGLRRWTTFCFYTKFILTIGSIFYLLVLLFL